ncbi:hypothetical protein GCM10010255_80890 [Streptomyces coeruleofuscus]|uniref:Uncharacterized protein n=1 Tax=Streptomyces coeruleofuscus TaxID=66879 RepID=A0ABN3JBJ3_9ACTN
MRGRGADRGGDVDGAAVVKDDRGVEHADQLREALLQARVGQLEDDGELFSELTRASRDQVTGRSALRGTGVGPENGCERRGC